MRIPFLELVRRRVVVLDGAMGSNLQLRTFDLQRQLSNVDAIYARVLEFKDGHQYGP